MILSEWGQNENTLWDYAKFKEYMGPVFFTPNNKHPPGYPGYYFPYVNQNHYLR